MDTTVTLECAKQTCINNPECVCKDRYNKDTTCIYITKSKNGCLLFDFPEVW